MRWLDRLERRFGRHGIPNLIIYVVAGRGLALLLSLSRPEFPGFLALDPAAVRNGEVWRLLTYLFMPPVMTAGLFGGVFGALIQLYFTWLIGRILESAWGEFRFTLYYLLGAAATAAAATILGGPATPEFLDLTMFLAFATAFPDFTVLLFFIIPVRMKWLGWFAAAGLGWTFIFHADLAGRIAIVVAISNYLLFFWPVLTGWRPPLRMPIPGSAVPTPPPPAAGPVHRCTTCGKTERDDPALEFRWCSCGRCGEGLEYCLPHLASHLGRPADA